MADAPSGQEASAAEPAVPPDLGPYRVLIADDDADVRYFLRLALELDGRFTVIGMAPTAAEAIRLLGSEQPDLAVLDLRLPDLAGLDLVRAARAVAPRCRIVVFTGVADAHLGAAVRTAGGAGILFKGGMTVDGLADALLAAVTVDDVYDLREGAPGA